MPYPVSGLIPGGELRAHPDVSCPAGATTLLLAANAQRREVVLGSLAGNTVAFRIGNSSAAAATGMVLNAGDAMVLSVQSAVYAYNPHTAAQSVFVAEVLS